MKCKELMVGDWVAIPRAFAMQITDLGEDYAYATWEDNQGDPWEFCDKEGYEPEPILLTYEILKKNGWKDDGLWHIYQDGMNTIQSCLPDMRGIINGIEIKDFQCEYVHQYQHLLRLCGLDELADNFEI